MRAFFQSRFGLLSCAYILLGMLCGGCAYRWGDGGLAGRYETLSVPFVKGDGEGDLTAAIVQAIVRAGGYEYRAEGGALLLQVELIDLKEENIGFRYEPKKTGGLHHEIIPAETRVTAVAQVVLVEAASGTTILGPVRIQASVDFDHDYYSSPNAVNVFSLGQLNDYDEAFDAVHQPLNQVLAQKIADFVNDSW